MPSTPYVVRAGDYLTQIASRFGTTVDDIWALPENADLKASRPNPEILAPLDVVYLPQTKPTAIALTVGSENNFVADVLTVSVKVVFKDEDGNALASQSVTTDPELDDTPPTTDGDGALTLKVPVTLTEIDVLIGDAPLTFTLQVGNLDPADTDTGLLSRLRQLGYLVDESTHAFARDWMQPVALEMQQEAVARGVSVYQAKNDKDVTGVPDDDLRSALRDEHGC
jgi:N-acetylmuramoyl-L-alanine amidase